ncbi:MAG: DUF3006 domain-containing protein [Firmicutes bacterium]|nr:DUF3006 domain-containing protein [Bacillota bacterium]
MKVIIDRFEGDFAVVETADKKTINLPKELVPNAKEGDVVIISIDKEESDARKKRMQALVDDLWVD